MMSDEKDVSFLLEEEPHKLNKYNFNCLEENSISLASGEFTLTSIESQAEIWGLAESVVNSCVDESHSWVNIKGIQKKDSSENLAGKSFAGNFGEIFVPRKDWQGTSQPDPDWLLMTATSSS